MNRSVKKQLSITILVLAGMFWLSTAEANLDGTCSVDTNMAYNGADSRSHWHSDYFVGLKKDGSLSAFWDVDTDGVGTDELGPPTNSGYVSVVSTTSNVAALHSDGSIATFGLKNGSTNPFTPTGNGYVRIFASQYSFSALKTDGSITTWSRNSAPVISIAAGGSDSDYVSVVSSDGAFAALKADGSITAWGNSSSGGTGEPSGNNYVRIVANGWAFAALGDDGSITAWGHSSNGGTGEPTDSDYVSIVGSYSAFAALKNDGTVSAWGNSGSGANSAPGGNGYVSLYSSSGGFAALKADGSIGGSSGPFGFGGPPSGSGYVSISSNNGDFAALHNDGSITTWPDANAAPPGNGYEKIASLDDYFIGLKADGSLAHGSASQALNSSGYVNIVSAGNLYAAMRSDGHVDFSGLSGSSYAIDPANYGYVSINGVSTDCFNTVPATLANDTDNDGTPDSTDTDDDGDGVSDIDEETNGTYSKSPDSDSDGKDDSTEGTLDTDSDGIMDALDSAVADADNDGVPDERDAANHNHGNDTDNDGYSNIAETLQGTDPEDAGSMPPAEIIGSTCGTDFNTAYNNPGARGFYNSATAPNYTSFLAMKEDGSYSSWGGGFRDSSFTDSDYVSIYPGNRSNFAALKEDGSITIVAGAYSETLLPENGYISVFSSTTAFLALKRDGSITIFPDDTAAPTDDGYVSITSTGRAYAALKDDGSITAWGRLISNSQQYDASVDAPTDSGYASITANGYAFAALKDDGSITAWGPTQSGFTMGASGEPTGTGYVSITSSSADFAALHEDGTVTSWGRAALFSNYISPPTDSDYVSIAAASYAFAALKDDGSISSWGALEDGFGVKQGAEGAPTDSGYVSIAANDSAFAALKDDGSLFSWGNPDAGGDGVIGLFTPDPNGKAPDGDGYVSIVSGSNSFAALHANGSIVSWGGLADNSPPTDSGYVSIFSKEDSFVAMKADGSLTYWGSLSTYSAPTDDGYVSVNGVDTACFNAISPLTQVVDTDGDGIPDATDTDDDNDGVNDSDEALVSTDPLDAETTDGIPDGSLDSDGDGIDNGTESDETLATTTDVAPADGNADINTALGIDGCPNDLVGTSYATSGGTPVTFNAPASDLGFVFDVDLLDNSFNLSVNGTLLVSDELQFYRYSPTIAGESLVIFKSDLSKYGESGNSDIWQIEGNAIGPVVRLIITENGDISLYGKRTTNSPLEELIIRNTDPQFNNIVWDAVNDNTVILSQKVQQNTAMEGTGSGAKFCTLDTDGDGTPDATDTDDDNDGVNDSDELLVGTDPKDAETTDGTPDGTLDTDGDGIDNGTESDETLATTTDVAPADGNPDITTALDTDGDGTPDATDTDDDNDGVNDSDEALVGTNPLLAETTSGTPDGTLDTDGDGIDNGTESDETLATVTDAAPADGSPDILTPLAIDDSASKVLEYRITYSDADQRYDVYMRPTATPVINQTLTGQVTIQVPTGSGFSVTALINHVPGAIWKAESRNNAPAANPGKDYLSFTLSGSGPFPWQNAQALKIFSFAAGSCPTAGDVRLMEPDDTTFSGLPDNHGNQFTNLGWGDTQSNNYLGNYGGPADCRDNDGDGLSNSQEAVYGTDPENADTDGDTLSDGEEAILNDGDAGVIDTDGDGLINPLDDDDDGDTVLTRYEDPDGDGDLNNDDTDGNGTPNYLDNDDDGDGTLTTDEHPDDNGDGNPADAQDNDGDGTPDYLDDQTVIMVNARVWLQGAAHATGMIDKLREAGLLPTQEPYSQAIPNPFTGHQGGETLSAALLATDGLSAPVDWVLVELRDATDPLQVLATQAAVVLRNSRIVAADTGSENLLFDMPGGDYQVAIRHRNHLGAMTLSPVTLSGTPVLVDFGSPGLDTWGTHARLISGDKALLRTGDVNHDGRIVTDGPNNDLTSLLSTVLATPDNADFNVNYIVTGYQNADLSLDGQSIYSGIGNDANLALGNILLHPDNSAMNGNHIISEQLPQEP